MVVARAGNTDASPLAPKAYGFNLNTDLRNDIFWYMKEQGYTTENSDRHYPDGVTKARP